MKLEKQNIFQKYLEKKDIDESSISSRSGPVITISREYGCNGEHLAQKIAEGINNLPAEKPRPKWSTISKEVLEIAAEELRTHPETISHIFDAKKKGFLENLAASFVKKYYVGDMRILKTLKKVIFSMAANGNVVIVGRASCAIAQKIPHSLHIKIIAPINYRADVISGRYHITLKQAKESINTVFVQRAAFMKFFIGEKRENEFYDIVINRSKFDEDYIVDLILSVAKDRDLI